MSEQVTVVPDIVAIDGPAGSGKSSVSKAVARDLGFGFLDTGAAYRSIAWLVLDRGLDTADADAVIAVLDEATITLSLDPDAFWARIDERTVTDEIREPRVSAAVSGVARVPEVRVRVNAFFRTLVASSGLPGVVIEGRDITTVVAPDAPVRILLTASPEVRAARRGAELGAASGADLGAVAAAITARDASDSSVVDFMTPAAGVRLVDSTDLDFAQTVAAVLAVVHDQTGGRHGR